MKPYYNGINIIFGSKLVFIGMNSIIIQC